MKNLDLEKIGRKKIVKYIPIGSNVPSQNTLILLNKNLKIYKSVVDKEVNIGQKAYDFPMVSQAAFEN